MFDNQKNITTFFFETKNLTEAYVLRFPLYRFLAIPALL